MKLFYENPNRSFYVREITRKIEEQINSVRRELANLLSIGIISSDTTNNRLYYEVNQSYEFYQPLSAIFGGSTAAAQPVSSKKKGASPKPKESEQEKEIKLLGNVELVIFTGQFTRDESSGTDILIVGDVNQAKLTKFMDELEQKEGKDVRYTLMAPSEFDYRRQINDRFLTTLMDSKKQIVIDKNERLTKKEE